MIVNFIKTEVILMSRIGIMGGTFNPIHNAHVAMAKQAYKQADLDKVLFMPSKNPPHKSSANILPENERAKMVKLAIKDIPYFNYSDFEIKREGTTYSAQTVELLHQQYPDDKFFFIMGADSFFQIETWYHPEQIMKRVVLLPVGRDDSDRVKMENQSRHLGEKYDAKVKLIEMDKMHISSSNIRKMISEDKDVSKFLSPSVLNYIKRNNFYRRQS